MAAAVGALLAANLIVALRWHLILSAASPSPGPATLLKIVFVGLFFNQVLPTGVGGDAVRAWRCSKRGIGLGASVRSILLDRACGYTVLVILYVAVLPSLLQVLPETRERVGVVAMLAAALVGLLGLVSLDRLPRPLSGLRMIAPFAELSREGRRLFHAPRTVRRCPWLVRVHDRAHHCRFQTYRRQYRQPGSTRNLDHGRPTRYPDPVPAEAALATSILLGMCMILIGLPGGLIWLVGWDITRPRLPPTARSLRSG